MRDDRALAASLLGCPVITCAWCDATRKRDDALCLTEYKRGDKGELLYCSSFWFCSMKCIQERSDAYPPEGARWWACSIMRKEGLRAGSMLQIGVLNPIVHAAAGWRWNDTGEALWIEERIEQLRLAGEDL